MMRFLILALTAPGMARAQTVIHVGDTTKQVVKITAVFTVDSLPFFHTPFSYDPRMDEFSMGPKKINVLAEGNLGRIGLHYLEVSGVSDTAVSEIIRKHAGEFLAEYEDILKSAPLEVVSAWAERRYRNGKWTDGGSGGSCLSGELRDSWMSIQKVLRSDLAKIISEGAVRIRVGIIGVPRGGPFEWRYHE